MSDSESESTRGLDQVAEGIDTPKSENRENKPYG